MRRAVFLLSLAVACTYEPMKLDVDLCPGCRGECVAGECVVPIGAQCVDNAVCRDGECVCGDAGCSIEVCSDLDCGACSYPQARACLPMDDGMPCVLDSTCTAEAACVSGTCTEMRARTCKDDDACTSEHCDAGHGCLYANSIDCGVTYFSYHRRWAAFALYVPIPPLDAVVEGTSVGFSVTPDLPAGLFLDPATGRIAGTPTEAVSGAEYAFTVNAGMAGAMVTTMELWVLPGFVVDTNDDDPDAVPGDTYCDNGLGACSLRAAVKEAGAAGEAHAIYIPPTAGEIALTGGPLAITTPMFIYGDQWDETRLNGAGNDARFFQITDGLWLSDIWIKHGNHDGAAILVEPGAELHVQRSRLQANHNTAPALPEIEEAGAIHGAPGSFTEVVYCWAGENLNDIPGANGPGVLSLQDASADVRYSTFENNTGRQGGVFRALGASVLTVDSCFSAGNTATNGDGGVVDAGAGDCFITLSNNTMVDNTAFGNAGAVFYSACATPPLVMHNTMVNNSAMTVLRIDPDGELYNNILINPAANECDDPMPGRGNLVDDESCGLAENRSIRAEDIALEDAGNYGGPTWTLRPTPDSPAVGGAANGECEVRDQRGLPRTDGACDAGAVELQ